MSAFAPVAALAQGFNLPAASARVLAALYEASGECVALDDLQAKALITRSTLYTAATRLHGALIRGGLVALTGQGYRLTEAGLEDCRRAVAEAVRNPPKPIVSRKRPDPGQRHDGFWTPERVAELEKLWVAGQSASQIMRAMGAASRSAVIGKVHRLGLSGRGRAAPSGPRPYKPRLTGPRGPAKNKVAIVASPPKPPSTPFVELPEGPGLCTILTIGAHMCKWPIGDPALDSFTLCGRRSGDGPYCADHAERAYSPPTDKRRSTAAELQRSLRRYA